MPNDTYIYLVHEAQPLSASFLQSHTVLVPKSGNADKLQFVQCYRSFTLCNVGHKVCQILSVKPLWAMRFAQFMEEVSRPSFVSREVPWIAAPPSPEKWQCCRLICPDTTCHKERVAVSWLHFFCNEVTIYLLNAKRYQYRIFSTFIPSNE